MVTVKKLKFPNSKDDQKLYEERLKFHRETIPSLDSHIEWFDENFWDHMMDELAAFEVDLEIVSRQIRAALPEDDVARLYRQRNLIEGCLKDRRDRLGITATKMKILRPKKQVRTSRLAGQATASANRE
jgi:hypothetical protein